MLTSQAYTVALVALLIAAAALWGLGVIEPTSGTRIVDLLVGILVGGSGAKALAARGGTSEG